MTGEANVWNPRTLIELSADTKQAEQRFSATSGQTLFTLTDFTYTVGTGSLAVFKNGARLAKGTSFVEQTAYTFSITIGCEAGDEILAVAQVAIEGTVETFEIDAIVANYQALRDFDGDNTTVYASGTATAGDDGGAWFNLFTGEATGYYVDDGVSIIVPTGGDGSSAWVKSTSVDITAIARSFGVLDSEVINSTDTTTELDDVLYIYVADQQVTYGVPALTTTGETIASVVDSTLTTSTGEVYTLQESALSQPYSFLTVAAYQAFTKAFPVGHKIYLADRNATFTVISGTETADGYGVIASTSLSQSISIVKTSTLHANNFGAFQDDESSVCTPAMQAYALYCDTNGVTFTVLSEATGIAEYKINAVIEFTENTRVRGIGAFLVRFLTEDCGLFTWPSGAANVLVENIRAGMEVRHTTTANTHVAIEFPGSESLSPYYNTVRGCFFDGFGINFNIEHAWEQRYKENTLLNCGSLVKARGVCVNNRFIDNTGTGDGQAFDIGEGSYTNEGWWIKNNLLDQFDSIIALRGGAFCKINDNIFDHITGTTGILFQSAGVYPAYGNHLKSNYIAFSGAGSEGVRLYNNLTNTSNVGNTIFDNEIFAYSDASLSKGLLIDGTGEEGNRILDNVIEADLYDVHVTSAPSDTKLIGNDFKGAGFITATSCFYSDNTGIVLSATSFLKRQFGQNIESWGTNQPSSGSWTQGDKVWREDTALDTYGMTLLGWLRLTTGSDHVAGTDWAAMRVSNVSPAT